MQAMGISFTFMEISGGNYYQSVAGDEDELGYRRQRHTSTEHCLSLPIPFTRRLYIDKSSTSPARFFHTTYILVAPPPFLEIIGCNLDQFIIISTGNSINLLLNPSEFAE